MAVTTRPKQTPSKPSAPGSPNVRTANSLRVGKNLDDHRRGKSDAEFFAHGLPRPPQEIQNPGTVEIGLALVHADDETILFQGTKPGQPVAERDQVKSDYVIAILAENFGSELPSLGLVAQPEQVLTELDLGGKVVGSQPERQSL